MGKLFDGKLVFTQIPLLLKYLPVTMELAVTAMIASLILGLLLALVKIKKVPVLKQLVSIYISVIRGTPILVQLYVTYFGIPMLLKYINFKCGTNYNVNGVAPIVYAFVALALNESAFNAGKAVLGADDVAGLVEILEGIRSVKEAGVPHRDIEILFTIAEELYIKGSSVFDFSKVRAKEAYVLDISGPVGSAAYKAPSLISYQVVVTGKASHAGFDPEHGVHAIAIASEAITQISQGHVDEETTCNIGLIEGGSGTNIVPEKCIVKGEIRSYSHEKATRCVEEVGNTFKKVAEKHGAESELTCEVHLIAYETAKDSVPVKRFERVSKELGLAGELVETFGGSDNNSFAKNGIPGLVLSNGMYQAHSVNEYTTIKDLVTGVELIAGLITDVQ